MSESLLCAKKGWISLENVLLTPENLTEKSRTNFKLSKRNVVKLSAFEFLFVVSKFRQADDGQ